MSNTHEQLPAQQLVILLGEDGLPVEAPKLELNSFDREVIDVLMLDAHKLLSGARDSMVAFWQKNAFDDPEELFRETFVGELGEMVGGDINTLLAASELETAVRIDPYDRVQLGLNPKEGLTTVIQRHMFLSSAEAGNFTICETEFPVNEISGEGDPVIFWKRIFSISKDLPQDKGIPASAPQPSPEV